MQELFKNSYAELEASFMDDEDPGKSRCLELFRKYKAEKDIPMLLEFYRYYERKGYSWVLFREALTDEESGYLKQLETQYKNVCKMIDEKKYSKESIGKDMCQRDFKDWFKENNYEYG